MDARTCLAAVAALALSALPLKAAGAQELRVSAPVVHENLAIYIVRGPSAPGRVPLTLQEAMAREAVHVHETSDVNTLQIENLSDQEVFVQSGDIVKGGKQDRVLTVSLVLPPRSGRMAIASFCVEQGRWSPRGRENASRFASADASVPSRETKFAMRAPRPAAPGRSSPGNDTAERQREVWRSVERTQARLTGSLGQSVQSEQSRSSLQLSLEHARVKETTERYAAALAPLGEADSDIVGYVFAINGRLNSGDVYASNGLFRKMWRKQLNASITEAIGERDNPGAEPPSAEMVLAFLQGAEQGAAQERALTPTVRLETRENPQALSFVTRVAGTAVHRNYLAK